MTPHERASARLWSNAAPVGTAPTITGGTSTMSTNELKGLDSPIVQALVRQAGGAKIAADLSKITLNRYVVVQYKGLDGGEYRFPVGHITLGFETRILPAEWAPKDRELDFSFDVGATNNGKRMTLVWDWEYEDPFAM